MGGDEPATQQTSSVSSPWEPAQGPLKALLKKYSQQSTGVTGAQSDAAGNLVDAATGLPNYGGAADTALSKGFNFSTQPQIGMLSDSFSDLSNRLGATANGANLDPYSTPGFGDAISRMTDDITSKVKGTYAAAGRDPSGAGSFAGSLGRGLTEGIAPVIQAQYNQNVGNMTDAAKTLYGAGGTTASGITAQQGAENAAGLGALGAAQTASDLYMNPAKAQQAAANNQYSLPWTNLAQMLNPLATIGGLGGQSQGTQTATQGNSTASNIMGGISASAALLPMMFSDPDLKEDAQPVGMLHDGQTVYKYRMKGSPKFQIGLMADEADPAYTAEVGGFKMLDYDKATKNAARIAA